jgi:UDP-glucose 4-epimerase
VTGSEGFIGKSLCKQLSQLPEQFELFTLDKVGNGHNHTCADITLNDLSGAFKQVNPEVVVHLAGNVSVSYSVSNPLEDFNLNAKGTLAVLLATKDTKCKNFVYVTSGGAIYDSTVLMPLNENSPIKPISPYGLSKLFAEGYVRVLSESRQSGWSSLAFSNVYGSVSDQKQGVIFRFWDDIRNGRRPTIFGEKASRDFIHVDDAVSALIKAIEKPVNTRLNISSNTSTKLVDLLIEIQRIMNSNVTPIIEELPNVEVEWSQLDNGKAQQLLAWSPVIDLKNGLKRSLQID